ncbi:MAG: AMP-binding protein [Actinomycetota bacterium]
MTHVGMSEYEWLRYWARARPDQEAVVFEGRRITYAELQRRVERLASGFRAALGLASGDRIAILSSNRPEFLESMFAASAAGLVFVPINYFQSAPEILALVEHCDPAAVIVDSTVAAQVRGGTLAPALEGRQTVWLGQPDGPGHAFEDLIAGGHPGHPGVVVDRSDVAMICYTSGTTGRPRGAVVTHEAIFWSASGVAAAQDLTSRDRIIMVLPLCFVAGAVALPGQALLRGATLVLEQGFDPEQAIHRIDSERISVLWAVTSQWPRLLEVPKAPEILSALRLAFIGAQPVPLDLLLRLVDMGIAINQGYGFTENCAGGSVVPPERSIEKCGSIGLPYLGSEMAVLDEAGRELPTGEVGELCFRSPSAMREYWQDPEQTAEAFRFGWLHTGDLARFDDDGFAFLVERKKDVIISGGINVFPAEVEAAILTLPQVAEVTVIGLADDRWGEAVTAVVVPKPDASPSVNDIIEPCNQLLARYKVPKQVIFQREPLPRTPGGKVLKRVVREQLSAAAVANGKAD